MRLFFGLPLGDAARKAVGTCIETFRERDPTRKVKWVREELLHVTLRFLGEVPKESLDNLAGWESGLKECRAISVSLGPLKTFPNVLYLQVEPAAPLHIIYRLLDEKLTSLGFPKEIRPYTPHLTIGRVRRGHPRPEDYPQHPEIQDILKAIVLFESHLTPSGPIYTPISQLPLI